ncbi:YggS family pyridoxal phosphate enzyme [Cladophialophora psammophila CBS 110553]|uniref:Pyridoxal phosphate homeostasis protein n=1 Tax=Cladophialophora psammophila CBS 110553 TaxID=1182543 RepID=W9X1F5_9EURO|nr:YggS family pyridoxal phosphate enzyme [Cladophialophora psammophila CBS 110553]EXJ71155.1 YggS family pyridoxal phosphate enzyme [Cladophialophora psammophila CBS 110553]
MNASNDTTAQSAASSSTIVTGETQNQNVDPSDMKITVNPQRATALWQNLLSVQQRVHSALCSSSSSSPSSAAPVRVVAVSKLKPASDILLLHRPPPLESSSTQAAQRGHDHFGENYVQELLEKSRLLPRTIKWHFIGGLQSNKCVGLARDVDSLWAVESVDSEKKAMLLNKGRGERNERLKKQHGQQIADGNSLEGKLRVFIQVNTSGEDSKSGLSPISPDLLSLATLIIRQCPNLHLQGLMTIGAIARSKATTPETENEDFITLRATRDKLAAQLSLQDTEELELSMGMSEDFESAVRLGSREVRVGSTIFGERPPKKGAKVLEQTEQEKK